MKSKFALIFIFLVSLVTQASAETCTTEDAFKDITFNCVSKYDKKIQQVGEGYKKYLERLDKLRAAKKVKDKEQKIKAAEFGYKTVLDMRTPDAAAEHLNKTFFFQTANGLLGKFVVRSAEVTRLECSVYIESVTFTKSGNLNTSSNFVIRNEANSWKNDTASLDFSGKSDFVLMREHGACALKSADGLAVEFGVTNEAEQITGNPILLYTSYFLLGLAVFLVMQTMFADEDRFKAELRLDEADEDEKKLVPNDVVLKYSRPFFKRYFSPVVGGMKLKFKKKIREKYKRKLASSGMNKFLTPEDFYAFKLFLPVGFPMVYLLGGKFLEMEVELSYVPFIIVLGYFYPDMWIREKITQRKEEIMVAMPFIVDMLALSVEAGLDFVGAIAKVIEKAPPSPLTEEFEIFLKETKVGASRAEGLRSMAWRIDSLPISSFCATLIAADTVGASNLSPILKALSDEIRQKRSSEIEKKGAQASTKILFPMLFLILPAVICIIAAPFIIGFVAG